MTRSLKNLRLILYVDQDTGLVHVHKGATFTNAQGETFTRGERMADNWLGTATSWSEALVGLPVDFPWSIRRT